MHTEYQFKYNKSKHKNRNFRSSVVILNTRSEVLRDRCIRQNIEFLTKIAYELSYFVF